MKIVKKPEDLVNENEVTVDLSSTLPALEFDGGDVMGVTGTSIPTAIEAAKSFRIGALINMDEVEAPKMAP